MKLIHQTFIVLSSIIVLSCSVMDRGQIIDDRTNDHIYSQLCNHLINKYSNEQHSLLVLEDHTYIPRGVKKINNDIYYIEKLRRSFEKIELSTIQNFYTENEQIDTLPKSLTTNIKADVIFLTPSESRSILQADNGWDRFYQKFSGANGLLALSKIGYDNNKKQALVAYGYFCGLHCGKGGLVFFQFKHSKWKIMEIITFWDP